MSPHCWTNPTLGPLVFNGEHGDNLAVDLSAPVRGSRRLWMWPVVSISSGRFSAWRKSTTPAIFGRCHGCRDKYHDISVHVESDPNSMTCCDTRYAYCYAQDLQQPRIYKLCLSQHVHEWDWSLCHVLNTRSSQCKRLLARLSF